MDEVRGLKGTLARFIPISGEDALFTDGEMTAYILDHCDIYFTPESRFFCKTELSDDRYYPYHEVILPRYQKEAEAFSDEAYRQTVEAKAFAMKIDFGHTSPNWEDILSLGFVGLKKRAEDYAAKFREDPRKSRFYAAVVKIYHAAERFVERVARKAEEEGRLELAQGLKNLLVAPPQNLFEGFQLLLLYHALQHFGEETWIRTFGRVDGLLYPVLEIPDEKENLARLGKYGRQAMKYLEENEPARYKNLLRTGRMTEKMLEVEEEANRMMEQLQKQYLKKNKPQNPSSTMEMWKLREQAKMMAEEIVLAEIVLKYH